MVDKKDTEKCDHDFWPADVFLLSNFSFAIVILKCSKENCEETTWDVAVAENQN